MKLSTALILMILAYVFCAKITPSLGQEIGNEIKAAQAARAQVINKALADAE